MRVERQKPGRVAWSLRKRQQLAGGETGYGKLDRVDQAELREHDQEMARQKWELLRRRARRG